MSMTEVCPFKHGKLRTELPPLIDDMKHLPLDERGYPIPFFVAYLNGKPEFQMADEEKYKRCIIQKLCWVCGKSLVRRRKAFVIGPMCSVNRISSEPPSHYECGVWSVKGCPFLSRPKMVRRENPALDGIKVEPAGVMLERNPGVMALWETNKWMMIPDSMGGKLFRLGDPVSVTWWHEGRPATRAEVAESFHTGLPVLTEGCHGDKHYLKLLDSQFKTALKYLPAP